MTGTERITGNNFPGYSLLEIPCEIMRAPSTHITSDKTVTTIIVNIFLLNWILKEKVTWVSNHINCAFY